MSKRICSENKKTKTRITNKFSPPICHPTVGVTPNVSLRNMCPSVICVIIASSDTPDSSFMHQPPLMNSSRPAATSDLTRPRMLSVCSRHQRMKKAIST
jgi:hypothetical protein